mgnify:CR=1 FL=1
MINNELWLIGKKINKRYIGMELREGDKELICLGLKSYSFADMFYWLEQFEPDLLDKYDGHVLFLEQGSEAYYFKGKIHKDDGPAVRSYRLNANGTRSFLEREEYIVDGFFHCEKGPALINYNSLGQIISSAYFLGGTSYSEKDWKEQIATKLYW